MHLPSPGASLSPTPNRTPRSSKTNVCAPHSRCGLGLGVGLGLGIGLGIGLATPTPTPTPAPTPTALQRQHADATLGARLAGVDQEQAISPPHLPCISPLSPPYLSYVT